MAPGTSAANASLREMDDRAGIGINSLVGQAIAFRGLSTADGMTEFHSSIISPAEVKIPVNV